MAESGSRRCLLSVIRSCAGPKICRAGLAMWLRFRREQMSVLCVKNTLGFATRLGKRIGLADFWASKAHGPAEIIRPIGSLAPPSPGAAPICDWLSAIGYSL